MIYQPKTESVKSGHSARSGFSLTELLVGMGIIGTLTAVTLPILSSARNSARESACKQQVRQWGTCIMGLTTESRNATFPKITTWDQFYDKTGIPESARRCPSDRKEEGPLAIYANFGRSYTSGVVGNLPLRILENMQQLTGDALGFHKGWAHHFYSDYSIKSMYQGE